MSQELTLIEHELSPIASRAISLTIKDDAMKKEAVVLLSTLNRWNDKITEEKEKVTRPLNEALKAEWLRWKPVETVYQDAITRLRTNMTEYQTRLTAEHKAQEEAIAKRIAPGKGNLKLDTAIAKLDKLPTVEKEHATDAGLVQFRETATLKVTDIGLIPALYFELDKAQLLKDLKAGKVVPGAEIEIIQTPVNYR